MGDASPAERTVDVVGTERVEVTLEGPTATVDATFRCSSGRPIPGEWVGVALSGLLDAATVPEATTHVRVRGADGFAVCPPIVDALDGIVATDRRLPEGESSEDNAGLPRFVAPAVSGTRTVQRVETIEALELDPSEDSDAYEDLQLEA